MGGGETAEPGAQRDIAFLQHGGIEFAGNHVITSHYTAWNFIPKNLAEQFSKPANLYFAFLTILQCLPKVTTTGGMPTIILPLSCIIGLNAIKDAIEDYRRHKSDDEENFRTTLCISGPGKAEVDTRWSDVMVGDLIIVQANEYVPADFVVVASAHEEGHVFIETANLDGETNLKTKQAPDQIQAMTGYNENLSEAGKVVAALKGSIQCEPPNEFLYSFIGAANISNAEGGTEKIPLDEQHVVLRGCKIKNVAWAMGVVVYTGKEAKIMMNSQKKSGRKLSHLEVDVGKFTLLIFVTQCVLCLIAAIVSAVFDSSQENKDKTYLNLTDEDGNEKMNLFLNLVVRFFNFMILFMNFIPISLLVSMSCVKLIQVYFFYCDKDMIYEGIHCMPRTSDLNEEMGQVEYVFSDKTGTLTRNVMDFRKFCVNGQTYGEGMTEIKRNVMLKMGKKVEEDTAKVKDPHQPITPHVDLVDTGLDNLLKSHSGPQYFAVRTFLMHLAINHEVIPEFSDDRTLSYSASSPDESALCYGARHFGFTLKARDSSGVTLQLNDGKVMKVQILVVLKFNSTRKRSSVVADFTDILPDGSTQQRLMLYTKGADVTLLPLLVQGAAGTSQIPNINGVLKEMAEDGLRTLCLAGRELSRSEFDAWLQNYNAAAVATENRADKLDEAAAEIERGLEFHGITGIEDRLQENVSQTIVSMTEAGIKVWMLTGDKTETAINIGIATGLLEAQPQEERRPLFSTSNYEDKDGVFQTDQMVTQLKTCAEKARELVSVGDMFEALVIDGKCLEISLEPSNSTDFVDIAKVCKTVVCCRVTPKQKGAVVRLIKSTQKAITLAIGDGANDCNMILSADVGIGIRGLEGLQAFNVCDYGISQFRFLAYLLLVHGRWSYRRVAVLVNYMFYKNVVVVLPQYYLGMVNGFSGQKLYNDFMYQMYNVIHSMFPIILFGIFDQDVSKAESLKHPKLFCLGPSRQYLNKKISCLWILAGVWHSLCAFWIPYYTMSNGNITNSDGKANDIWLVGTVVYLIVVIIVNAIVVIETCSLTWMTWVSVSLSFFFWFGEHGIFSGFFTGSVITAELHGTTQRLLSSPMIWILILACSAIAVMVDVHLKGLHRAWFPSEMHKVQQKILAQKPK